MRFHAISSLIVSFYFTFSIIELIHYRLPLSPDGTDRPVPLSYTTLLTLSP